MKAWEICVDSLCGAIRCAELSAPELVEALADIRAAVRDYPGQLPPAEGVRP